ncbi:MAG: GAF domain-containing protein [Calothrix sp. MO_167.B42]|nr:GAF domain-containing protein [Calothrix sp. MO_167.B42]
MTQNYPHTPTNGQGLSYPEQNFSESPSAVEESESIRIYQQPANGHIPWTDSFADVVKLIRTCVNQEDILATATEEIRRVIGCDRIVVYGLNPESQGVVIAESVAPDLTQALGMTIEDPCFAARYIEKYQNGRVKATDNIYEANLTPCYIEQLEKLEVKGHLVAPIVNQGELFGLLVAHECSGPRHWQGEEVRWFSQIAMQVGFALDYAKVVAEAGNLRQQMDVESQWAQYFTDTVQLIRQSLKSEDVLKTATEEVRRILACDRVVIYGLKSDSEGEIIAESVVPGFIQALGMIIQDPCFAARYMEKYQNGRVRATDNIYKTNFTPCYIEQLEKLQVKGNLVAPILNQGELLGLLVAHQCSGPRHWQEYEIRWFSQIAMQVGFALDHAKVLAETTDITQKADTETQWTQYLTDTVRLISQSLNQQHIFQTSVKEVHRILSCDRVVIYSLNEKLQGMIIAESVVPNFLKALGLIIKDPCFEARYIQKYQNGRVRATDDIYQTNFTPCYIEQLEKLQVRANLVAPILNEGKLLGLLVAHQCARPRHWQEYEIRWFSQIATHIGFALDHAKIMERNHQEYELNHSTSFSQRIFLSQQEELRQVVVELIEDNQAIFTAFSTQARNLSNTLVASLKRIQRVFDTAKSLRDTTEQAQRQMQHNSYLLGEGRKSLKSTLERISVFPETTTDDGITVQLLNQHCQQLSELMDNLAICLGEPINSQTIALENSQGEGIIINTEEVYQLREQLCAVITETQPLLTCAIARIDEIIETGAQQKSAWTQSLQTTEEKLDSIVTATMEMSKLVDNMAQIVTNQAQISDEAGQYVVAASKIVHQMLEQSQSLGKWFTRLLTFCQENMQKIMFWENIKGFLRSSRKLVAFFTPKD